MTRREEVAAAARSAAVAPDLTSAVALLLSGALPVRTPATGAAA
jgi:hypothetical protein